MRRNLILFVMLMSLSFSLYAQRTYFDIGLGAGSAKTTLDEKEIPINSSSDIGVELGLKLGFAPLAGTPFYIVGELSGIGHRIEYNSDSIQFNSYLMGGGVLLYPFSFVQLGASLGYSLVANTFNESSSSVGSTGGFAWNVYGAFDLGGGQNGLLLGARYSEATNTLETGIDQKSTMISGFIKYAYRHKVKKEASW